MGRRRRSPDKFQMIPTRALPPGHGADRSLPRCRRRTLTCLPKSRVWTGKVRNSNVTGYKAARGRRSRRSDEPWRRLAPCWAVMGGCLIPWARGGGGPPTDPRLIERKPSDNPNRGTVCKMPGRHSSKLPASSKTSPSGKRPQPRRTQGDTVAQCNEGPGTERGRRPAR